MAARKRRAEIGHEIETFMARLAVEIGMVPTVAEGREQHRQLVRQAEIEHSRAGRPARRAVGRLRVLDGGRA